MSQYLKTLALLRALARNEEEDYEICTAVGLCYNAGELGGTLLHKAVEQWPEFSGDRSFPVPSFDPEQTPEGAYYAYKNKWDASTPYGACRRRLCGWFAEWIEKNILRTKDILDLNTGLTTEDYCALRPIWASYVERCTLRPYPQVGEFVRVGETLRRVLLVEGETLSLSSASECTQDNPIYLGPTGVDVGSYGSSCNMTVTLEDVKSTNNVSPGKFWCDFRPDHAVDLRLPCRVWKLV